MAGITIRNLDDGVKTWLRMRADGNGHSVEKEVRLILRQAVQHRNVPRNLAAALRAWITPLGSVDPELPQRGPMRKPPSFE